MHLVVWRLRLSQRQRLAEPQSDPSQEKGPSDADQNVNIITSLLPLLGSLLGGCKKANSIGAKRKVSGSINVFSL
jgi:hypothetical protein